MELYEQDNYLCEIDDIELTAMSSLFALYQPMIGSAAIALYGTLLGEGRSSEPRQHSRLVKIMHCDIKTIETARISLEQFNLLRTFYNRSNDIYIYQLIKPLNATAFCAHYVYGVQLKKALGISDYELTRGIYGKREFDRSGFQEISAKFDQKQLRVISTKDIEEFISVKAKDIKDDKNMGFPPEFDYQAFVSGLSELTFPRKLRTTENMRLIAQLATVYGIDIQRMRILACRSIDIDKGVFDQEALIRRSRREQPDLNAISGSGYDMAPINFLQNKQPGIPVSLSAKRILEYLINDTPLSVPVINYLVEYVLDNANNILNQKYVEKVAETFVRSKVENLEAARELIKKLSTNNTNRKKTSRRPVLTVNYDNTAASKEDIAALSQRVKKKVESFK